MTDLTQMDQEARDAYLEMVADELILKLVSDLNERGFSTAEILPALGDACDKRFREFLKEPHPSDESDAEKIT